ncbi:MAG TPA: ABC transporter substrate-binding protein [Cyanobacteria bacterium UBA11369]|nr:ABC transporter substrate-binding protein [Cyanobacteria bacterium UBA11371]HBE30482.1 ABC transporter substrate-binding protein [Cyanobacteria bacterium UBA11368]HBE51168.1 ABC transporter substrate-binding protein [Cyanobacteria bacterium UBA11369]
MNILPLFRFHKMISLLSSIFDSYKNLLHNLSKYLLLVCLGICLLSAAGCQSQLARNDEAGVMRLTLWQGVNPPPNRDVLQGLVDKFNQTHRDIQVESLYVGQADQQMPKILASVVGNAPPDMLWYNPTIAGQLVELGAIRSLDDLLAASPVKKEINPALFETMQLGNQIWSVPFATNNVGIFYRPSLFKEAGITQLPKTWSEFRQVARQLTRDTNGDGRIDRYGMLLPLGKGEWTVFTWLPFMWSGGGGLQQEGGSKGVNIVNEGAIASLQFWRNLIDDGSAILSLPERGYELDGFLAGKVAMQITGPWTLGQLQSSQVDYGVFPIPAQARSATSLGGENLFIFKTTPEREKAAFKFAEYVLSQEFQTEWALKTGYLPVNVKASQSKAYQEFANKTPAVKVFLSQAKNARSRPIFPGYNRISENLGRAIEAVLLGKSSPAEALKASQKRLDLIFQ